MRTRYAVLVMLVLLMAITYMDRICIGVTAVPMQKSLGISESQWGWVLGAFYLAYGIFEVPTGALGDWIGQRKVLTRIVAWWSAFTVFTGLATNYYMLVATRFLFGAGEAGAFPNAAGVVGRWFPLSERARAQGVVLAASRLGGALAPPIVVLMLKFLPWQAPYFLFGAIGIVWAVAWMIWFRDTPAEHPSVTPQELAEIGPVHSTASHTNVPWLALLISPQLWLIMAMYWFYVFCIGFLMMRLPQYLMQGRGFSDNEMAACFALAFALGAVGNITGGWVSDRLSPRLGLRLGRVLPGTVCLAIAGAIFWVTPLMPGKLGVALLMILAFGVLDGMLPAAWAVCLDVGKRYAGAVSGAMNMSGQGGAYVCVVLYGYLIEWYRDYELPMPMYAVSLWISALLFAFINPTRPLVPAEPEATAPAEA